MTERYTHFRKQNNFCSTMTAAKAPQLSAKETRLGRLLRFLKKYKIHANERKPFLCITLNVFFP